MPFGDLFSSSSKSSQNTLNSNVQGTGGPNLSGITTGKNSTITLVASDPGALAAAQEVVAEGFDLAGRYAELVREGDRDNLEKFELLTTSAERSNLNAMAAAQEAWNRAGDTVQESLSRAFDAGEEALDFGREALFVTRDASRSALDAVGDIAGETIIGNRALVGDVIESFGNFARTSAQDVLGAISAIQQRESTNNDARLEEISSKALTGAAVVAGLAVLGALYAMTRRR